MTLYLNKKNCVALHCLWQSEDEYLRNGDWPELVPLMDKIGNSIIEGGLIVDLQDYQVRALILFLIRKGSTEVFE